MSLFVVLAKKREGTLREISAGAENYSLVIDKNGRAWGWGQNNDGELGNAATTTHCTPVSVRGAVKTFCQISAGYSHSLAIDKNGRAWGWGSGYYGKLGNNSASAYYTPVSVAGAVKTFCQISAGIGSSLAIDKNGRAWGWGHNNRGEVGDGSTISRRTPVSVAGAVKTFCQISAGWDYSLAIDKNGRAWGWGNNDRGQLGNNTVDSERTPVSVAGAVKTFCQISAGEIGHSVAIDKNGRAWGWGYNDRGQLGNNTVNSERTPVSVAGAVKTFCQISGGDLHSLAIDKNGRAWGWGNNDRGQLGDNSITCRLTPVSVAGAVKTFCQISAGGTGLSVAIDKDKRAWAWGNNHVGQLGISETPVYRTPVSVAGAVKTFCQIGTGAFYHSVVTDKNGRAWGWGYNSYGKLGDGTTVNRFSPVSVAGAVKTFCQISGGDLHSLAIDKNGRAWAWGHNDGGRLGDNSITCRCTPVSVAGAVKTFCQISAGNSFSIAIDKDGRAWGWGYNTYGGLGDNTTISQRTPVSVAGAVKTFCQISAGVGSSLAIDKNGRAWGWGYNNGRLGDNTTISQRTPVSVAGAVKTFCQIRAGWYNSLAIDKNGRAWGWGNNDRGQLGDNSITCRLTPVSVAGAVKTFCQISGAYYSSAAIDKNGRAWGWGYNFYGQLGDNTTISRRTPVSVAGAVKTFCQIRVGVYYVIAIDKNGRAWGWGASFSAYLGRPIWSTTPVRVCFI